MNNKITFPELIELVAQAANTSKRMSELFLKELFATVSQALIDGENVKIKNLGQFKVEEVKSRRSVSVNTGQEVEIPTHTRIVFTPAKSLADAVNQPFAQFESIILDDSITEQMLDALDTAQAAPAEEPVAAPAEEPVAAPVEEPVAAPAVTPPPFTLASPPAIPELPATPDLPAIPVTLDLPAIPAIPATPATPDLPVTPAPQEPVEDDVPQALYEGVSIVEHERAKREVARKSTIRGALYGALGMLAVALVVIGIYCLGTGANEHEVVQADTIAEQTQPVAKQEVVPADTVEDVKAENKVVTDTCTKTMFLTRMAKKHYGNRDFWVYIYEENKDKIDNPNRITPGTVVVIPPAEKYGIDPDDPESVKQARIRSSQVFSKYPPVGAKASKGKKRKK